MRLRDSLILGILFIFSLIIPIRWYKVHGTRMAENLLVGLSSVE